LNQEYKKICYGCWKKEKEKSTEGRAEGREKPKQEKGSRARKASRLSSRNLKPKKKTVRQGEAKKRGESRRKENERRDEKKKTLLTGRRGLGGKREGGASDDGGETLFSAGLETNWGERGASQQNEGPQKKQGCLLTSKITENPPKNQNRGTKRRELVWVRRGFDSDTCLVEGKSKKKKKLHRIGSGRKRKRTPSPGVFMV